MVTTNWAKICTPISALWKSSETLMTKKLENSIIGKRLLGRSKKVQEV